MKKLSEIMSIISLDFQTDLPALLTAEGLTQFEEIQIGQSRDSKKLSFLIYDNSIFRDVENRNLSLYFQAQLYRIDYETALKYIDVISDYFDSYDPENLGMVLYNGTDIEVFEIDHNLGTHAYFKVDFSEPLDSCD